MIPWLHPLPGGSAPKCGGGSAADSLLSCQTVDKLAGFFEVTRWKLEDSSFWPTNSVIPSVT